MSHSLLDIHPEPRRVETELWGACWVRVAKASELDRILTIMDATKGSERFVQLALIGTCHADGSRAFVPDDVSSLRDAPLEPVAALATAFLEVNGIMEGGEKKSSIPLSGSLTTLPENLATPIRRKSSTT